MKGLYFLGEVLLRSPGIKTGDYKKRFDLEPHMSVLGTRMRMGFILEVACCMV